MTVLSRSHFRAFAAILLAACSPAKSANDAGTSTITDAGHDGGSADASMIQTIGAAGGTVHVGDVTVTIPAGALAANTVIDVTPGATPPVALPTTLTAATQVVKFLPHGTHFSVPVTVEIPLSAGAPTTDLSAWFLADDQDTTWEEIGAGTVANGKLTFQTTHLCYCAGAHLAAQNGCGPTCPSGCQSGTTCVAGSCQQIVANACGPADGYQVNSPAPTEGGCEYRTRRTSAHGPTTTPTVAWHFPSGTATDALVMGPAIAADGAIYVTSEKGLIKLDPSNGHETWRVPASTSSNSVTMRGPPILGADGNILGCTSTGLSKFSACDGSVLWHADNTICWGDQPLMAVPVIGVNGNIYLPKGSILSSSGQLLHDPPNALPCGESDLALDAAGNVYCNGLYSFDATGAFRWTNAAGNMAYQGPVTINASGTQKMGVFSSRGSHYRITMFPLTGNPALVDDYGDRFSNEYLSDTTLGHFAVLSNGDFVFVNEGGDALTGGVERYTFAPSSVAAGDPVPTPSPVWQSTTAQGTRFGYAGGTYPTVDADDNTYYGTFHGHAVAISPTGTTLWDVTVVQNSDPAAWSVTLGADHTAYVLAGAGFRQNIGLYALRAP
jgi:outer membrane protein assembly factor BamB